MELYAVSRIISKTATIFCGLLTFFTLSAVWEITPARAASAPTRGESLDELYEMAKKEGGKLNLYASLSGASIEVILPAFQKRFPGIVVDHTDATGDKLIARIVTEGRGGRVIPDAFGAGLAYISQMTEQKLLAPLSIPRPPCIQASSKANFGWRRTHSFLLSAGTLTW